jgi:hypothetical protein
MEALYGTMLGISEIGGSKLVRKSLLCNKIWRRITNEKSDNTLSKKNTMASYILVCCLSVLARTISYLPEFQQYLQIHQNYYCIMKKNFESLNFKEEYYGLEFKEFLKGKWLTPACIRTPLFSLSNLDIGPCENMIHRRISHVQESSLLIRFIDLLGEKIIPYIKIRPFP